MAKTGPYPNQRVSSGDSDDQPIIWAKGATADAPASGDGVGGEGPLDGDLWYDTTLNLWFVYDTSSWKAFPGSGDPTLAGSLTVSGSLTIVAGQLYPAQGITMTDAKDIIVGTTTGTKIGSAAAQKLGFWGATPVVQQATIADPTGGGTVDAEARTAVDAILVVLETAGLVATS